MWWIGNAWEKFDTVASLFSVQKMRNEVYPEKRIRDTYALYIDQHKHYH